MGGGTHDEHEDHPWTRIIPDHPKRTDSAAYRRTRKKVNEVAATAQPFAFGAAPYQAHHGGGLWLKDEHGWFVIRNLFGIEWSAQFCADPRKVDLLRRNAKRIYAVFPKAVVELGIAALLDHEIQTPADVAVWTDSVCNASVPLPTDLHVGVLPKFGGIHHYPSPVAEIAIFKFDDFQLWVTDTDKTKYAVVPVSARGSGDGRVRLLFREPSPDDPVSPRDRTRARLRAAAVAASDGDILPPDHPLARQAFRKQA
jgi:Family of unknown function (DUF6424)